MFNFIGRPYNTDREALSYFDEAQLRDCGNLLRAVAKTNVGDTDRTALESILGTARPVASPNCANHPLLRYAAMRTRSALISAAIAQPDAEFEIGRWSPDVIGIADAQRLHLPTIRRRITALSKQRYSFALIRLIPVAQGGEFRFGAIGFGVKEASPNLRRRSRAPSAAGTTLPSAVPVQHDKISLSCVALELWSSSFPNDNDALPEGPPVTKAERRKAHIDRFVIDALTRPASAFLGFGVFRKIARSVLDEVAARARSLDLGGTAPIQPAGINAFLAGLNVDKAGTRVILPPITNK